MMPPPGEPFRPAVTWLLTRHKMTVLTFGLEGDTMRTALSEGTYCKAGLAMFPEITAPVCIEAAIAAYQPDTIAFTA